MHAWQLGNVLGSNNASDVRPFSAVLADRLLELAVAPARAGSGSSGFFDSCVHHCSDKQWGAVAIGGVLMRDAYSRRHSIAASYL